MGLRSAFARATSAFRAPVGKGNKLGVGLVAAFGLAAGFGGAVFVAVHANRPLPEPPRFAGPHVPAPDFVVPGADGRPVSLKGLRGHVVVLNIWATWCSPCRQELPVLDSLAASYDTARVVVLALSVDVASAAALHYLAQHPYPHLRFGFAGGRLGRVLGYRGLPTTLLVDTDGRSVATFGGWGYPSEIPTLRRLIAHLQAGV